LQAWQAGIMADNKKTKKKTIGKTANDLLDGELKIFFTHE